MKWYKPFSIFVSKKFSGKKKWQHYFSLLQSFAVTAMNYGNGSRIDDSGEKKAIEFVATKLLIEKPIIFDVGANVGKYAKSILDVLNGNAIIHCFEPSLATSEKLQKNLQPYGNVFVHRLALSNSPGEAILYGRQSNSEVASLVQTATSEKYGTRTEEHVTLTTIDDFCRVKNISGIYFLKIDVEGNELKVLQGAEEMLAAKNIQFIQFEFGMFNIDSRTYFRDLWALLHGNYRIFRVVKDGLYEIKQYSPMLEIFYTSNFIAELK
jgi:FkbM family methyltransferase